MCCCWLDGVADLVLPPSVGPYMWWAVMHAMRLARMSGRRQRRRCVSYIYVELIYQTISLYIIARMQMQMLCTQERQNYIETHVCMHNVKRIILKLIKIEIVFMCESTVDCGALFHRPPTHDKL